MRYLKRYALFTEDVFAIKATDQPNVSMSKEQLNSLVKYLKDFKAKKPLIDKIYLDSKDDNELKTKIEKLLGPQVSNKLDRNPFMTEYLTVSDMKRRLDRTRKDIVDDKLKLDDFGEELKNSTDSDQKASVNIKISDISKRMGLANTSISKLSSDINKAENSLKVKMTKMETDMKKRINNISK